MDDYEKNVNYTSNKIQLYPKIGYIFQEKIN